MSDEPQDAPKLHIDSDWKEEARREKERLAEEVEQEADKNEQNGGEGPEGFPELVEILATQAIVSLGGMTTPTGERIPPNVGAAKHFIDLLGVLQVKTKGNLTEDEDRRLVAVLTELRQVFTRTVSSVAAAPPGAAPPPSPPNA